MLLKITNYGDLDKRKLMDIYAESNFENTDFFYPEEPDKERALRMVEAGYLGFLENEFFATPGNIYWVLEENGLWVSALRTSRIEPGLYFIEALETRPDCRQKGYGTRLLQEIVEELKQEGPFRLCSTASKKNTASLKTHLKSGFVIVSEEGFDYLAGEAFSSDYGLEYRYSGEG